MKTLLLLALLTNTADAALTCHTLARGGRELNPFLPQSCAGIAAIKAAALATTFAIPVGRARTIWLGSVLAGGSLGVGVSVALRRAW